MNSKRKKWKFDLTALKKGDILFTRSKFIGTGIAKITKGQFGHVMLYLGNMIIHADTKGVWSKNPQRILMNEQSRLAVYRLKDPLTDESLKRVEHFARSRIGSIYSIPQALSTLQKPIRKTTDRYLLDRQFCSRLVAQCFSTADIQLVNYIDYCTPNEISESALLQELPHAIIPANAADIEFCKTPDYNLHIQAETYKWLNKVRDLAKKHQLREINAQSDVALWVYDHPQFDAEICKYIRSTNYLSLYDSDKRKLPWRYNNHAMLEALKNAQDPKHALAFEHQQHENIMKHLSNELKIANNNAKSGLEYCKLEEQLLIDRLVLMSEWKDAINHAKRFIG